MHKSFGEVVDLPSKAADQQQTVVATPKRLPGLQPWFRFGEYFTRDDWIESFGINLDRINEKAAKAYLEGEAAFFAPDAEDYIPATVVGKQCALATRQAKLENFRHQFILAATNLCQSPIEQLMLASLCWARWSRQRRLVEIWDSTGVFPKPEAAIVIAPQYQIEGHRVDFAVFVNVIADEEITISIECDGHWHEQSKEQAARDKRQQNGVTFADWRPLRYTGSDIWWHYKAKAEEVSRFAARQIKRALRRWDLE
jgi:hypothetical protein